MTQRALVVFLLFASANVQAQTREAAANKESLVKDVLRVSNSQRLFDELTAVYTDSLMQGLSTVNPEIRDELKKVILENFKAPIVGTVLEREFSKAMDVESLQEVKRWYETAVGKKVRDLEISERYVPNRPEKLRQFARELSTTPTPEPRMNLFAAFETKAQVGEHTLDATVKLMVTMMGNMMLRQTEEYKKAFLSQMETSFRGLSGRQMATDTILSHQYVYRSLSDEELRQYTEFLGSPAGQKYSRSFWTTLQSTLEEVGTSAGRGCAEVLRRYGGLN
jgi:hypothetical protein